jgi:hypothetical protein
VWFVERTTGGWSEPKHVGSPTDLERDEGTLYFGAALEEGHGGSDVYRIQYVEGRYSEPENVGTPINTAADEYVVLTAPDERYLVLYRHDRTDTACSGLYVCFALSDGTWAEPIYVDDSLGLVLGFDASLSPDGQILFLLDRGAGVYWVDAGVLDSFVE